MNGVRLVGHIFFPKLPLPLRGSSPPLNTLFIGSSPLIMSNGMSIGSSVFVCVPNAMLYSGEENPFPAIGDAAYCQRSGGGPSHGHRQYAQKIWQRSCMWFWRYLCGQTDRLTDILITILCNCSHGQVIKHQLQKQTRNIQYTVFIH